MKLPAEKKPPNPARKATQINIRVGHETEDDLAFLSKFYPEWSTGKIVRACLAIVAKMHKEKAK